MGCWHGYGHGCSPGPCWPVPPPRDWYDLPDEDGYDDANWPLRRRARRRPLDRDAGAARLEAQLAELREEMRRVEAVLEKLRRPESTGAPG